MRCVSGTVGPTARASGVDRDARRDDPYAAYSELSFKVVVDDHCDVYGRTIVRLGELMETYSMIRQIVKQMPDGPIADQGPPPHPRRRSGEPLRGAAGRGRPLRARERYREARSA